MKTESTIKLGITMLALLSSTFINLIQAQSDSISGEYKQVNITYTFYVGGTVRVDAWGYKNWIITQNVNEIEINGNSGTIANDNNFQVSGVLVGETGGLQNYSGNYDPNLKKISGTFTGTVARIGTDGKKYIDEISNGAFSGTKSTSINADFYGTPTSGVTPLTVQFTDQSTGDITSRSWDFGDGQTSTSVNPSHTYQNVGTYTVQLTATGPGESNTKTRTNYINVTSSSTPVANFYGSPTSGVAPLTVQFTDQSTGDITSRSWDFGDDQTSTSVSPSHTYQNVGTYTVQLTATGPGGTNTKTLTNYITVTSSSTPVANFYGSPTSGVAPLTVQFTDQSTGDITSRSWDFGDGQTSTSVNPSHTYQNVGTYTVILSLTGSGGANTKTLNNYIEVFTTGTNLITNPEFDHGMDNWYTYLQHDSRYTMSIDNNYVLSGQNSLKYVIEEGGTQDWYITVFGYVPLQKDKYYEVRFQAKLENKPSKNIRLSFQLEGDPWTVYEEQVTALSATIINYGPFIFKPNVNDPIGRFNFALGLTNNVLIYLDAVYVAEYNPISQVVGFSATPVSGEAPLLVNFYDESSGPITNWLWSFGDGNTSNKQNPNHIYETAGPYTVSLKVTGDSGSYTETKTDYIIVTNPTGIVDLKAVNKNLIFPNPAKAICTVKLPDGISGTVDIKILNSNGVVLISKTGIKEKLYEINLSELKAGLYYISIISDNNNLTNKLIIME